MKKILPLFMVMLLLFPAVLALNLEIEKLSKDEVMIAGIDKPATFLLSIKNLGPDEMIEFYNLIGFSMFPRGTVSIGAFETKEIEVHVSPIGEFEHLGKYTFKYFISGLNGSEIEKSLTFTRLELKEALEIGAGSFDPESNSIDIFIKNKENFDLGEIKGKFSSTFFNKEASFNLGPNQRKNITIDLDKEEFKQLMAGFYTLNAEIQAKNARALFEIPLKFEEKQLIASSEDNFGAIIVTKIMKKTNEGNTVANAQISVKKNIISRLFTTFAPEPDIVDRKAFLVQYTWNKEIKPGEIFEVTVKTNYMFPLIIIILIVVIIALAKHYTSTNLVLKKKVTFVRAKGGEFALKISIFAHARKYLENVTIIDKLPPLVKIYEKFGQEKPSKIDEKYKRIEWKYEKLESGEIRMMTYIIYSKVGVIGKFALPETRGLYERDGKIHETESNKTFFIAEPRKEEEN